MCLCGCSSANKCSLKVAQYAAQLEQYDKAIEIYEQVSRSSDRCSLFHSLAPGTCGSNF